MRDPAKISVARVLKLAISLCVNCYSILERYLLLVVGKKKNGQCVVIYYHSIPTEQREWFAGQMNFLIKTTKPLNLGQQIDLEPGNRYTAVTFDDAFEDFIWNALPELEARKIPATIFAISSALGKSFGPPGSPKRVMSRNQLCQLPRELIFIGSHTQTHPNLRDVKPEQARREIIESKRELENLLGYGVNTISFPFGGFNGVCVEFCREAGYERVFTTLPAFTSMGPGEYLVGRVRVDPTDWPLEFRLKLAGAYRWLPWAIRCKRQIANSSALRTFRKKATAKGESGYSGSVIQDRPET